MAGIEIRPYRAADCDALIALFRGAVRRIASRDYSRERVMAWAPDAIDRVRFDAKRKAATTWVAELDGMAAGFADLDPGGHIDMLYVHADCQGMGVARALLRQIESAARDAGIEQFHAEASITARPVFERFGFRAIAAQTVVAGGIAFENFRMERRLV